MRHSGESPALDDGKASERGLELFSGRLPTTGFQQRDNVPRSRFRIGPQSRRSRQRIDSQGSIAARQ